MSQVLILGAGFVSGPLVSYLSRKNYSLTVASHLIHEAEAVADKYTDVTPILLDVADRDALMAQVKRHDLVVSFVPFAYHEYVAEACLEAAKHLVTASYETEQMRTFHDEALAKNICIVNEIGLDPGIDHLSAMQVFDDIIEAGSELDSFVSWCGGIPAPSANNNPLGYKFSWSPKSVLLALLNDAKYINNGKSQVIPEEQLLLNTEQVQFSESLTLEGYPNRDSTNYVERYDIGHAKKVLRGTLRYQGFAEILQSCKELQMLDQQKTVAKQWAGKSWTDYITSKSPGSLDNFLEQKPSLVTQALNWLGITNHSAIIGSTETMLDAFCELLISKLTYAEDEADMVVMQHQFTSTTASGETEFRTSSLILEGDPQGFSAMAKTVGTPAAIMVDMILTGQVSQKGVILPLSKEIYVPMLAELAKEGIHLTESISINA
ncbi:MAG: saccharopine dehydrogenase NADP-binding domain-containing protein [Gammaproteobacteria bacterium]|nr:saccharopine dehydrogenase NADP-binding domain-containing protein [Gammaproteobacteria bacterium]